ncbi:hypothetical protein K7432_003020 [Basidiobolus ranarum]|uniref:Uncharacterized protein n=1 Tax=Basidiobolus ranarum TaxID=34480 RepID=A0ABR2X0L9_9FUNG
MDSVIQPKGQPESLEENELHEKLEENLKLNTEPILALDQEVDDSDKASENSNHQMETPTICIDTSNVFPDIPADFGQIEPSSSGSSQKVINELVAEFDPLNNLSKKQPADQIDSEERSNVDPHIELPQEQTTKIRVKSNGPKKKLRGESLQKSISVGGTPSTTPPIKNDNASSAPESSESTQKADQFEYHRFLDQIRHRSATPVARSLKRFLSGFQRKPYTVNEQIQTIHGFLNEIAYDMRYCEVWNKCSESEFENALEGMEKLIMNKLYKHTFCPLTADDMEKDDILNQKIQLYRWIKEEHLDIPVNNHNESFLGFAQAELAKINSYKAPRDKLICILNCCIHVEAETGADKFLPILIFVVLRANPERLVSNVQYISRFRRPEKLHAESEYYLTNLVRNIPSHVNCKSVQPLTLYNIDPNKMGAISFIENMDYKQLSISEEDFNKNIDMAVEEIARRQSSSEPMARSLSFDGARRPGHSDSHLHPQIRDSVGSDIGSDFDDEYDQSQQRSTNSSLPQIQPKSANPTTNPAYPGARSQIQRQRNTAMQEQQYQEYNQALSTLKDMFPNIEADICELILQANQGELQPSIEALLDISNSIIPESNPL